MDVEPLEVPDVDLDVEPLEVPDVDLDVELLELPDVDVDVEPLEVPDVDVDVEPLVLLDVDVDVSGFLEVSTVVAVDEVVKVLKAVRVESVVIADSAAVELVDEVVNGVTVDEVEVDAAVLWLAEGPVGERAPKSAVADCAVRESDASNKNSSDVVRVSDEAMRCV